jgi:putative endonuclease
MLTSGQSPTLTLDYFGGYMYYVYVLKSDDETYIGVTGDLKRRFSEHNSETNTGYTKNRKWMLIYYEAYQDKSHAYTREKRLKNDGRAKHQLFVRIGLK